MSRLNEAKDNNVGAGPAWTPVRSVLDVVSAPAYAIGNVAAGRPVDAVKNLATLGQFGRKTMLSDALREKGVMPGGVGGTLLGLGLDIATDPTTYVTFGAGGVAKGAAKQGAMVIEREAAEAAAKGARIPIKSVAEAAATREKALAEGQHTLAVGFRVPFTRHKTITLAESRKARAAGEKVASAIGNTRMGENLREVFLPAGSGSKAAHRIGSDARRYGEAEKRVISRQAVAFQRQLVKDAKAVGMKPDEAYQALVRSLDQPTKYPVPEGLEGLRDDARSILDDLDRMEKDAGIERGDVESYVPHVAKDAKAQRQLEHQFPLDPSRPYFFQKQRELPNLDAWEAIGLKPEYNLARLIEVRGHASVDARVMKAFEDAVQDVPGIDSSDVQRVLSIMRPQVSSHYAVEDTKRFINSVGSSWKSLALLSPGYHMRNLQSDLMTAWWAGARNPHSFVQAARLLRGKGTIKIGDKVYTAAEITTLAESVGAIRIGQIGKEIKGEIAESGGVKNLGKGRLRPSRPGQGKLATGSGNIGNAREDLVRMGTFLERMKAGDDAMTAGRTVRDFLFDYGDVGKFVASARKFWLPFITFTSKAVPMVGRVAVTRPGTLASLNKATHALNEASGSPDLSLLPAGQRSSFAIPLPGIARTIMGAPQGQPILFNPESVMAYGALNSADPTNPVRSAAGFLTPFAKAPIEAQTGYSFYFGSPSPKRVKAPAVINLLAKVGVPIPNYGPKRVYYPEGSPPVAGYSSALDTLLRMFPPFSQSAGLIPGGGAETTRLPYLRYFGGLSAAPYDQAKAQYYAERFGSK